MEVSQHVRAIMSFVEAADTRNFSLAARRLGISPAAVSKNIAGLEQVLGVRLMNRTTRKIRLTEEGESFLAQAGIAVDALTLAVDNIVASKLEIRGRVKISTSMAIGHEYLVPALPGLRTAYPHLSVDVDFDDRVSDLVQDGYDLALRVGRISDSSMITRHICHLNTVLVAAPTYLARHGAPASPAALPQHDLIARRFLAGKLSLWGFTAGDGSQFDFEPNTAVLTLSAPEAVLQAALAGIGIAQVGVHHALRYLQEGALQILLWGQYNPGGYDLVLQYPHRSLIAPRVKTTATYLMNVFERDSRLHTPLKNLAQYQYPHQDKT